jgi:hypothetical protein
MAMRGIGKPGSVTVDLGSARRFQDRRTRAEAMRLILGL